MVKVSEVEPGKMCMKCVADVRHVLLCDDACEMVYEWREEEGGDERASKWRVEKEGVCGRDEMAVGEVQRRGEWGCDVSDVVAAGGCQRFEVLIGRDMELVGKGRKEVDIVVLE